jgi:hypothetical protein
MSDSHGTGALVVPGVSTWEAAIDEYGYTSVKLTPNQLLIPHHY